MRGSLLELEGDVFDARFRIEERIAEGGFAVVYKAWQVALERRVALKVLKAPRNQDAVRRAEFRERFAAEAKTIARLRHPDIVDVYDFSVSTLPSGELAPWMTLEWLDGETLARQLGRRRHAARRGRPPEEAIALLRPVMRALAHAHRQGIVHRDIKPSNIMVTETPHGASLRVLDFGIAKIMVDTQTPNTGNTRTESAPAFSPAYAAPEQVAFSRTGPWTDVHALGLLLTEVMTDEAPFSDPDPEAHFFEQVMAPRRPTPASKGHDVGPFEPIVARALALSPRHRWRDASELLAALDDALAGRRVANDTSPAIVTAPRGPTPRPRRSRRATVAVGLGAVALAVVGGAWTVSKVSKVSKVSEKGGPYAERSRAIAAATPVPTSSPVVSGLEAPPRADVTAAPAETPREKEKKRARVVRVPLKLGDGRDLFNDTK